MRALRAWLRSLGLGLVGLVGTVAMAAGVCTIFALPIWAVVSLYHWCGAACGH